MPQQLTKTHKGGTGLAFTRISDTSLIPQYLVDQIEPKEWDTPRFYEMVRRTAENPLCFLGVFTDKSNVIQGFIWGLPNPLTEKLFVYALSVNKEYQWKGMLKEATAICKRYIKEKGLKGLAIQTTRPAAFEKIGFSRSKIINMEL